jgi:phosphatidylglycerol lysyltransferase
MMKNDKFWVWIATLVTAGSGLVNIFSVISIRHPERFAVVRDMFPLEFIHLSRFVVLFLGFTLVITSINIYKRKRRAYLLTIMLSILSFGFHLLKGLNIEEASFSLLILMILYLVRHTFRVKSSLPNLRRGILRLAVVLVLAILYGVAGFWFLDPQQFGTNFHFQEAIRQTFLFLGLIGNSELIPRTHYARWFLDSLYLTSIGAIIYSLWALFRPVRYIYHTLPLERVRAKQIVEKYGRHDLDFFKFWSDKSFFFLENSFLAYRVGINTAVVLADPVGPLDEIERIIAAFQSYCEENDWKLIFHQTLPDYLEIYEKLGFTKIKIGDDAIVDLTNFTLEGRANKEQRHYLNKFEKLGVQVTRYPPPVPNEVLTKTKGVSDEWLRIGGHRERGFTLGCFEETYLRNTTIVAAIDAQENMLAFVNLIPSYRPGEATIDLMRRREQAPGGIMDYLFVKVFLLCQEKGFTRFSLGMAPMSGFKEGEPATAEEKAIHSFMRHLNFLFSFKGLYEFKAKYASSWEPRYVVLRSILDLPRHALAITAVSELK